MSCREWRFSWSRMRWFANDFHEWRSREWKSLANHITNDQKIVIHDSECIISFLYAILCYKHNSAKKNNRRSLISPLSPKTVLPDLALWRHHSWTVMSREREVLALWCYIRPLFFHEQIGAKTVFISGITTVNIDFSPFTAERVRNLHNL